MKNIIITLIFVLGLNAHAEQYRIIVPFGVGATPDIQTRKIFAEVSKETGDTFIIVNKPGAETLIGYKYFLEENVHDKNLIFMSHSSYYIGFMTSDENFSIDKMTKPLATIQKFRYSLVTQKDSILENMSDIKGKLNVGGTTKLCLNAIQSIKKDRELQFISYTNDKDAFLNLINGDLNLVCTGSNSVAYSAVKDKTKIIKNFNTEIDFGVTSGYVVGKNMSDEDIKKLNTSINNTYNNEVLKNWFIQISDMPPEIGQPVVYLKHVRELKRYMDTYGISLK